MSSSSERNKKKRRQHDIILDPLYNDVGITMTMGQGDGGQLGLGDNKTNPRKKPAIISLLQDKNIIHIKAGAMHNVVLSKDGEVYTWGNGDEGALGFIDENDALFQPKKIEFKDDNVNIIDIDAGDSHTIALSNNGKVYMWGMYRDNNGAMGSTNSHDKQPIPIKIEFFNDSRRRVAQIAAGDNHDLVLTRSGSLYTWGDINQGLRKSRRLRHSYLQPHRILLPSGSKVSRIFCTGFTNFVLLKNGNLLSWGLNNRGQTGIGHTNNVDTPKLINTFDKYGGILQICGDTHHTLFLCVDGSLWSVGENNSGQLGIGNKKSMDIVTQINVPLNNNNDKIIKIAAGGSVSFAITKNGDLFSWGYGDLLQLGHTLEQDDDFTFPDILTPKYVESKQLTEMNRQVINISGGSQHTILLAKDKN